MSFPGQGGAGEQVTLRRGGELTLENRRIRNVPDRQKEPVELQVAQRVVLGRAQLDAGEHVVAVLLARR